LIEKFIVAFFLFAFIRLNRGQDVQRVDDWDALLSSIENHSDAIVEEDVLIKDSLRVRDGTHLSLKGSSSGSSLDGENAAQLIRVSDGSHLALDNLVLKRGFSSGNGGALLLENASSTLLRISILNSRATRGGAIALSHNSKLIAIDCIFSNNIVSDRGGGIYVEHSSTIDLRESVFRSNHANRGAAIYLYSHTSMSIVRNLFEANKALYYAGAVFVDRYSVANASHCIFKQAEDTIYVTDLSTVHLSNCSGLNAYVAGHDFEACATNFSKASDVSYMQCYNSVSSSSLNRKHTPDQADPTITSADDLFGRGFSIPLGSLSVAYFPPANYQ